MVSHPFPQLAIFTLLALAISACTALASPIPAQPAATVTPRPPFTIVRQAGIFTLYSLEDDQTALGDVANALLAYAPQVSRSLDYDYRFAVTVELFPDQASLDRLGMNPDL